MREISNLDIKIQLTNEYLRTGGIKKIYDAQLLQDIIDVKFNFDGKAIPATVTSRLNAFMLGLLHSHTVPPFLSDDYISEYASFIQKSLCFDQIKIDTKEQVDKLFETYNGTNSILFRGQREASWRLYSSLQRFWIWDKMQAAGEDYLEFLQKIIKKGTAHYEHEIKKILGEINIDSINDISVLGFLQHHNCPTPLLDWTYSFETAMFFGVDGLQVTNSEREIDSYFSLYFIEEKYFDTAGARTSLNESLEKIGEQLKLDLIAQIAEDESQRQEMEEHFRGRSFFDKKRIKGSGLINHATKIDYMITLPMTYFSDKDIESGIAFSITNSKNIKRQNGVFTWNSHHAKPLETIGDEQYSEANPESDPNDYRFCECYNINKELMEYIAQKLSDLQITRESIYPDKDLDAKHVYDESKKTHD